MVRRSLLGDLGWADGQAGWLKSGVMLTEHKLSLAYYKESYSVYLATNC
jgi:hypothetical protein